MGVFSSGTGSTEGTDVPAEGSAEKQERGGYKSTMDRRNG